MTKQKILEYFKDINHAYNESTRFDDLSHMLDELMQSNSDEDCISRETISKAINEMLKWINSNNRGSEDYFIVDKIEEIISELDIEHLPSIQPKPIRGDAISREEVCKYIREFVNHEYATDREREMVGCMIAGIQHIQSIHPNEKTGHWIAQDIHNCHTDFRCSACGYTHSFMHLYGKPTADYTYCPNCGVKMEGATE